jgi:hypothetical protein
LLKVGRKREEGRSQTAKAGELGIMSYDFNAGK